MGNNPEVAKPKEMLTGRQWEYICPPTPFAIEIQLDSLARESKRSASDPAVVSQGTATLQPPGDSQENVKGAQESSWLS